MIGIYKITSPSKKIYIGQSVNIEKRWKMYSYLYCKHQQKLYNSFIKYGVNKHKFEIVQLCEIEQLNELEKYYVDLFQTFNSKYGLNLQDGGGANGSMSEETKRKIGLAHKGKFISDETRLKISLANRNPSKETILKRSLYQKGRKNSPEAIRKTALGNTGQKRSEEVKLKISIALTGKKRTKESIENIRLSHCKLILNTETGIYYFGSVEASSSCSMNDSTLRSMLNGRKANKTNFIYV